ncbi:hypothetical protein FHS61_002341 [Altererythrobacter atlanticus]|uniref:Uncharacterized protein n=1 Tax=Croceibacterium atlanticum TaxID=1267766 RepID=A0A0F7KR90_9SPHN|nr:hypothetical protein [Croceibacterium atlanticum]AKH42124.1 hypothetical protein WYH_01077 [Croceibacterium atlanticum]MBB5733306.1 hypothetical protein [Croceibacterium atlanticum]
MTNEQSEASSPADRYDQVAALLQAYPHIDEQQLQDLKQWFRKASAFDVASLASNETIVAGYTQFRREHIDRISLKEAIYAIIGVSICFSLFALVGLFAP